MSHGPINCGPDTGDTDWRHVFFEVCVEWGLVLENPYELMTQEVLDDLMAQDWDFTQGPPCGYYMTGCGRRTTPNPNWHASHPDNPAYQAWYNSATSYSQGSPGIGSIAQNPTYTPPSGFWGGGLFLHCVKFDGRAPNVNDIGNWVDFTPYAGFPMKLRVCEIGPQCSYSPLQFTSSSVGPGRRDELFGGHFDFNLYSFDPCDCEPYQPLTPIIPTCEDTISCPCGWTPIYDHPIAGEISCKSPTVISSQGDPQTLTMPAIERKCMLLHDYSMGANPITILPQVHHMWEHQPANPALWNQLAWNKAYIVEISGSYQWSNPSFETRAFLPCDIPNYIDPWPTPFTPVGP